MKELVLISAQPYDLYFTWQVEVQIVNFRKFNLSDKMRVLVWCLPDNHPEYENWVKMKPIWLTLQHKYPEVQFHFYVDEGLDLSLYIPILRPFCLKKHFAEFPDLKDKVIFYHDSDIIFNYLPDFHKLIDGDICWQSDTSGYLDYDYLRSKEIEGKIPEEEAVKALCDIGGITVDKMKEYNRDKKGTGGAQYIFKGIDSDFWQDVYNMCIEIRKKFMYGQPDSINTRYFANENAGFQSWCADMWAVNMSLWKRNIETGVTKELDFSWATDTAETYKQKPIYHNAGSNGVQPGIFHKRHFMNMSPIGLKIANVSPTSASFYYKKAIEDVK